MDFRPPGHTDSRPRDQEEFDMTVVSRRVIARRHPIGWTIVAGLALLAAAAALVVVNWPTAIHEVTFAFSFALGS